MDTLVVGKKCGFAEAHYNIQLAADPWENKIATKQAKKAAKDNKDKWKRIKLDLKQQLSEDDWKTLDLEATNHLWLGRNEVEIAKEKEMRPRGVDIDHKAVHNLTNHTIPEDILLALSWGPKFVFPAEIVDAKEVVPMLENMVNNKLSPLVLEEAMKQVSIILTAKNKIKETTERSSWLNLIRIRTTAFFKQHKDVVVVNSDKGKHMVVMYEVDYVDKMTRMLNDVSTYAKTEDKREENINKNGELVEKLIECEAIEERNKFRYVNKTATTAKIYGLPKIHKNGAPLRPITSTVNAPGSKLATLMTEVLSTIFHRGNLHLKNSLEAKKLLDKLELEEGDALASFDVVSMFTNIPLKLAKDIIMKKRREILIRFNIQQELLNEILDFLLIDCAVFTYKEVTYTQIRGLAMGSPLSPLLAQIVMTDLMEKQLPLLTIQPKLLRVYVDDTISAIKKTAIKETLRVLNLYNASIQFTLEVEDTNNEINFLDMTLKREDTKITTNWYKKTFASDRMLNYFSCHENQTIRATAMAHIKTVLNLSDGKYFHQNKEKIEKKLRLNNFPETVIMGLMNENYTIMAPTTKRSITNGNNPFGMNEDIVARMMKNYGKTNQPKTKEKAFTYGVTPSIDGMNTRMRHTLQDFAPDIRITTRPNRANSRICSSIKDRTSTLDKTNLTLYAKCNCEKKEAITRTVYQERGGSALTRMKEKYKFDEDTCTHNTHHFKEENVKAKEGGNIYKEYIRKSMAIAYTKRDRLLDCNWELPHRRMRKHLKKDNGNDHN